MSLLSPSIFKTVFMLSVPDTVVRVEYSPSVIFVVFESMMSRTLFAFNAIETFGSLCLVAGVQSFLVYPLDYLLH